MRNIYRTAGEDEARQKALTRHFNALTEALYQTFVQTGQRPQSSSALVQFGPWYQRRSRRDFVNLSAEHVRANDAFQDFLQAASNLGLAVSGLRTVDANFFRPPALMYAVTSFREAAGKHIENEVPTNLFETPPLGYDFGAPPNSIFTFQDAPKPR